MREIMPNVKFAALWWHINQVKPVWVPHDRQHHFGDESAFVPLCGASSSELRQIDL
jgi:hypothetical protein